jgi:prepilin-type N-terminal cleavage/methylation domain-containing protein
MVMASHKRIRMRGSQGFTLAELLIALLILAEIATFTIPKILASTAGNQNRAIVKETAGMISGVFKNYQLQNTISASLKGSDITQYMNYVKVDTSSTYTGTSGTALQACTATLPCLTLHNGGILQYDTVMTLGGTGATNAVYFNLDPDGNGSEGRITLILFSNGRLSTGEVAGTATPTGGTIARQATDPTYFSW